MAKTRVAPDPNVGRNIAVLMEGSITLNSQPALAKRTGVAQSTIGRILRAEVNPTGDNLRKIAGAFGVDVGTLYWQTERFSEAMRAGKLVRLEDEAEIHLAENPAFPSIRRVKFRLSAGASGFGVEYLDENDPQLQRPRLEKTPDTVIEVRKP